ncbi:MAG: thermonuclease family protein [Candidatus Firestonebacteria bacterium]|nr:thermonuclease family protein [Candidatus Firestonebacteria bacterium]
MSKIAAIFSLLVGLLFGVVLAGETLTSLREKANIIKVFDGDTVLLKDGRTIRLIGVDTPETNHPSLPAQRYGKEATAFTKNISEGKDCEVEFEENNKKDVHGRNVAYLYVDGKLLNAELLKEGLAYVYVKYDFKFKSDFIEYQKQAIRKRKGLWNIKDRSAGAK